MRKNAGLAALALALSIAGAGTAFAGWSQDDTGWWFQYEDGRYAKSGIREVDGGVYCFDENGYMMKGWQYVNWKWRYFHGDGTLAVGWLELDGKWYYLDPENEGEMHTYWLDLPDSVKKSKINRYYLDENGVMQKGTFYLSDDTSGSSYAYMTDENGILIRNRSTKQGDTEIKYAEDGRIRFRNAQTKMDAKENGTDEWQYLLSETELERISEDENENDHQDDDEDYYD